MTNILRPEFDRLRRISLEIKTALDEFHRELQQSGQEGEPLSWRNGHSLYEQELKALQEKHGVNYTIEWNDDGRTVKAVRVRAIRELEDNE